MNSTALVPRAARGDRDSLSVVAGAGGNDAATELVLAQARDPVVGAANLERARALQVLRLERDRRRRRASRSRRRRTSESRGRSREWSVRRPRSARSRAAALQPCWPSVPGYRRVGYSPRDVPASRTARTRYRHRGALCPPPARDAAAWQRRYGNVFSTRFPVFGTGVYVAEPDEIRAMFTGDQSEMLAGEANSLLAPVLGENSVLVLDGARHLRQRKLLLPPFQGLRGHHLPLDHSRCRRGGGRDVDAQATSSRCASGCGRSRSRSSAARSSG